MPSPSKAAPVSYAADIHDLFRDFDAQEMINAKGFDLHKYQDVVAKADKILHRLRAGTMPCDGAWPKAQVDLFAQWIADGKQP